jgi:flagellar biosynthesis/type III secretory pathway chaperone
MRAAAELLCVLDDEFAALLQSDARALERALGRKQALLTEISRMPGLVGASEHAQLVDRNARNARALAPRAQANSAGLQVLLTAAGRAPLYGAGGALATR